MSRAGSRPLAPPLPRCPRHCPWKSGQRRGGMGRALLLQDMTSPAPSTARMVGTGGPGARAPRSPGEWYESQPSALHPTPTAEKRSSAPRNPPHCHPTQETTWAGRAHMCLSGLGGSWSLGRRLSMRLTFTSGAGPGPDNLSHQPQICHWRGRGSRDSPGGTAGTSSSRGSGLSALTSKAPSAPPLSSPKRELPAAPSAAPPASAGIEGDRTAQKSRLLQIKKKKVPSP